MNNTFDYENGLFFCGNYYGAGYPVTDEQLAQEEEYQEMYPETTHIAQPEVACVKEHERT